MGARYTESELASVREMVAVGMTDEEIAERLGRTPRGIDPCMTNETMREYRAMKAAGRLGKLGEVAASVRR